MGFQALQGIDYITMLVYRIHTGSGSVFGRRIKTDEDFCREATVGGGDPL